MSINQIQELSDSLNKAFDLAISLRDQAADKEGKDPYWEDDYLIWDEVSIDINEALQRIGA